MPVMNAVADVKTNLLLFYEPLVLFLLTSLSDSLEALQHAALSGLEFILDNIGCSIDELFCPILTALIEQYPRTQTESDGDQELSTALMDHYSRLIETCYDLVPHFNHSVLHRILDDVISKQLSGKDVPVQIRIQLLRFLVLVATRTKGDLSLPSELLSQLLQLLQDQQSTLHNAAMKCWDSLTQNLLLCVSSRYYGSFTYIAYD